MRELVDNSIVPEETVFFKAKVDSRKMKEEAIDKMMRMLLDGVEAADINLA